MMPVPASASARQCQCPPGDEIRNGTPDYRRVIGNSTAGAMETTFRTYFEQLAKLVRSFQSGDLRDGKINAPANRI